MPTNILSTIKFFLPLPFLLFLVTGVSGQICTDNDSANNWNNSWMSCQKSSNPNPARRKSHWVMYEFDQPQSITLSHIWNANRNGESKMGIKEAFVDYSLDGITWTALGSFTFPKAAEKSAYDGFEGPDFEGVFVSKILITVVDTYGDGECASLAEIRFNVNPNACYGEVDACGVCNGEGQRLWYLDQDGDGLGDPGSAIQGCEAPIGYVANADDDCDTGVIGWATVGPIFQENGCTGCHGAGAAGGLNLTSYATAVMGGNKCGTNILTGTTLVDIITTDQYDGCGTAFFGPSMNDRVGGNIDDEELALIGKWIQDGAPEDCSCPGDAPDADNDGFCDAIDQCPDIDNSLIGTPCDDGSDCTTNDVWREDCNCRGDLIDSDNDGICDRDDAAPNNPCTADGTIDGNEPAGWVAQPTNDCDMDGISIASGDLNDFSECIDDVGLLMTAECSCGDNSVPSGGVVIDYVGMSRNEAQAAAGMPDGLFSDELRNEEDTLILQFPFMETGEQICLTVGFSSNNGSMRIFLNNRLMTFDNDRNLGNYQSQEFCFSALNSGVQTLMITEDGGGDMRVDGTTYSACPCDATAGGPDITDVGCLVNFPDLGWRELTDCTLEICEGQSITLGTDRYETITYQWRGPNGLTANASSLNFEAVKPSDSGIYWLYYQNSSGCDLIKLIELIVIPAPPVVMTYTNPGCGFQNGEIALSFEDDPERSNIEFSINGENGDYLQVADNIGQFVYSNLSAGNYDVWTRWSNGDCPTQLGAFELVDQPAPTVDAGPDIEICEGEAVSILPLVTGSGLTYSWSNGRNQRRLIDRPELETYADQTFTYRVTVTDNNGCFDRDRVEVKMKSKPKALIDLSHPANGKDNGSIIFTYKDHPDHTMMEISLNGEAGPYEAMRDDIGEYAFNNLGEGNYEVWIRWADDYSCPVNMGVVKLKSGNKCPNIKVSVTKDDICEGDKIRLTVQNNSKWTYAWSNGATTAAQNLYPVPSSYADEVIRYEVTVTDQNGCTKSDFKDVTVRSVPKVEYEVEHPHCGKDDGTITLTYPDHPSHQYLQFSLKGESSGFKTANDGKGKFVFRNLPAGKYNLWARWKKNGSCPVPIAVVQLEDIPGPIVDLGEDFTVCEQEAFVLRVKKVGGMSYRWNNGVKKNGQEIVPKLGSYKNKKLKYAITVTDQFGCKASDNIEVTVASKPRARYTFSRPTCGKKNGEITFTFNNHPDQKIMEISITGKKGKYARVEDKKKKKTFKNLGAGTYRAYARWKDDSCPVYLGEIKLLDIPGPNIDAGPDLTVCDGKEFVLRVNQKNGWTYRWSNGVKKPVQKMKVNMNKYTHVEKLYRINVTDKLKCKATDEVKVTIMSMPKATYDVEHPNCGKRDGFITLKFPDHATESKIEFSITGKNGNYIRKRDDIGSINFSKLPAGRYDIWARWPSGHCAVRIGKVDLKEQKNCLTSDPEESTDMETIATSPTQADQMANPSLPYEQPEKEQPITTDSTPKMTSSAEVPTTDLEVFPNPTTANTSITIRYYADTDRAPLKIMDPTGRLVKTVDPSLIRAGWNELRVGLENVATGTYIVLDGKGNYKLFVVMQ